MRQLQVVKVGTDSVFHDGCVDYSVLFNLGYDLAKLRDEFNTDSVLVVSGSVRLGMWAREIDEKPKEKTQKQRCARVGQPRLMRHYDEGLNYGYQRYDKKAKLLTAQYEVTHHHLNDTLELRNFCDGLRGDLQEGILPLINYNDDIDASEIDRDNDKLAARVAGALIADRLVIITDTGLRHSGGGLVKTVDEVTEEIMALCMDEGAKGTGGMRAKLEAASMLWNQGIPTIIGDKNYGLQRLIGDEEIRTIVKRKYL